MTIVAQVLTVAVVVLLAVIGTLATLLYLFHRTYRDGQSQSYKERISAQYRYCRMLQDQRDEIQRLTESYTRAMGVPYVPKPITPVEPEKLIPTKSAWAMRPNPPRGVTVAGGQVHKER